MREKKDLDNFNTETLEESIAEFDEAIDVEEVEEIEEIEEIEEGIVVDCVNLNIREKPDLNSAVLCTVPASTKLLIDMAKSTMTWLYVYTESGIEGFCMKQFVGIK